MAAAQPVDVAGLVARALELGGLLRDARQPQRWRLSREAWLAGCLELAGVADLAALEELAAKVRALPNLAQVCSLVATDWSRRPPVQPVPVDTLTAASASREPLAYVERLTSNLPLEACSAVVALWAAQSPGPGFFGTASSPAEPVDRLAALGRELAALDAALLEGLRLVDLAWPGPVLRAGGLELSIADPGRIALALAELIATVAPTHSPATA